MFDHCRVILQFNLSNGAGLLDCFYFSCSATPPMAFIQFHYYMLFILLSKYKLSRVLTHAIKTVFVMALPSRNRGLGKGRAAKG